jgi:TrmH family RNA methyltransferase
VVEAALDRGSSPQRVYLAPGAERGFPDLVARVRRAGIEIAHLKEGVLERIGATVTPQPVLAVVTRTRASTATLPTTLPVLVLVSVQDPGNAGTLLRSAEASGAAGVVFCGNSVDPYSPKVVRSSAGAILGTQVVEGDEPVGVLEGLRAAGRRLLGALPAEGEPFDTVDLTGAVALALGNEARGLPEDVVRLLDGAVTIPVAREGQSLNVAMAGTVLCFEAARQRRARESHARGLRLRIPDPRAPGLGGAS